MRLHITFIRNKKAHIMTSSIRGSRRAAKRNLIIVLVAVLVVVAAVIGTNIVRTASAAKNTNRVVTVGITGESQKPIWDAVQAELDSQHAGITIVTKAFRDGAILNQVVSDGEVDLNAFQHYAYFNDEKAKNNYQLTPIADTYICELNLYSDKYKSLKDFKPGDRIAIPEDATNFGRALKVLDSAGLIRLKDRTKANPGLEDIADNPSGIKITPNDAATILNLLPDYAAGITNDNYVIDAGRELDSALYRPKISLTDQAFKPYINILVANTAKKDDPAYAKVIKAYHTKRVAEVIKTNFKGAVLPAFTY